MHALSQKIDNAYQRLAVDFTDADPFSIGKARRLLSRFQTQADYLTTLEESLETHFHQKQIETRMAERLGGARNLRALEYGTPVPDRGVVGLVDLRHDSRSGQHPALVAHVPEHLFHRRILLCDLHE